MIKYKVNDYFLLDYNATTNDAIIKRLQGDAGFGCTYAYYAYCTGFIINLANIFGFYYYEVNALIFCIVFPLLTAILTFMYIFQIMRLRKLKKQTLQYQT